MKGMNMDAIKKHKDTLVIIGSMVASVAVSIIWLMSTMHAIEERMNIRFYDLDRRIYELDKRLIRIETVLMIKGILPDHLAIQEE